MEICGQWGQRGAGLLGNTWWGVEQAAGVPGNPCSGGQRGVVCWQTTVERPTRSRCARKTMGRERARSRSASKSRARKTMKNMPNTQPGGQWCLDLLPSSRYQIRLVQSVLSKLCATTFFLRNNVIDWRKCLWIYKCVCTVQFSTVILI